MNEFIHNEALKHQEDRKGVTTLFYYVPDKFHQTVVGFITLRGWNAVEKLNKLPSIMIANLGVDNRWRSKGIGTQIFLWGLGQAEKMNTCCAFAYVVWDSTSDHAESFYKMKADGILSTTIDIGLSFKLWRQFVIVPKFTSKVTLKEFT
jgi:GNAT superfamily N-acetyltransferase